MSNLTVVCEDCGNVVEGIIDAVVTKNDEPLIMTGGFRLEHDGAYCDDCAES